MSQSLQDLLSSDKFDNPPPGIPSTPPNTTTTGETLSYSNSVEIAQDNEEDKESESSFANTQQDGDSLAYSACTRLYIVGEFITVLQKMESLGKFSEPGVLVTVDVDDVSELSICSNEKARKKWDTLFFKTIISMDITELSRSRKDTLIALYDLVFLYTNTLFHAIVQDSNIGNPQRNSTGVVPNTKFTIEYIFELIQAYYVLTFNATTNYKNLKNFSKILQGYIKYTSKSDFAESENDDVFIYYVYKMCEFYIFELEINGLHKVVNKGLYYDLISNNTEISNIIDFLKNTKYESAILEKLERNSVVNGTAVVTKYSSNTLKKKDTKASSHFKLQKMSPKRYENSSEFWGNESNKLTVDENETFNNNNKNGALNKLDHNLSQIKNRLLVYTSNARLFYSRMSIMNKTVFNSSIVFSLVLILVSIVKYRRNKKIRSPSRVLSLSPRSKYNFFEVLKMLARLL